MSRDHRLLILLQGFRQKVAKHRTGMLGENIRKQLLEMEKQH